LAKTGQPAIRDENCALPPPNPRSRICCKAQPAAELGHKQKQEKRTRPFTDHRKRPIIGIELRPPISGRGSACAADRAPTVSSTQDTETECHMAKPVKTKAEKTDPVKAKPVRKRTLRPDHPEAGVRRGPRATAGRTRAAHNARYHGLSVPAFPCAGAGAVRFGKTNSAEKPNEIKGTHHEAARPAIQHALGCSRTAPDVPAPPRFPDSNPAKQFPAINSTISVEIDLAGGGRHIPDECRSTCRDAANAPRGECHDNR
jgi:hypothetical protein